MLPTAPLVVHEDENKFGASKHKIAGPVRWVPLLSADRAPASEIVLGVAETVPIESGEFHQHSHDHVEAYYILPGYGVSC